MREVYEIFEIVAISMLVATVVLIAMIALFWIDLSCGLVGLFCVGTVLFLWQTKKFAKQL